jgi:hypothetical protein
MTTDDIILDLSAIAPYEAGAVLLSVLALPGGTTADRENMMLSLCNIAIRAQFPIEGESALDAKFIKPVYAFRYEEDILRDLKKIGALLRDRIVAARIAIPFLQRAAGTDVRLPQDVKRLSINEMVKSAARDLQKEGREENIETRIWRPSLPVIHIAAAVATELQSLERAGTELGENGWAYIMAHRWLVESIVTEAALYAALIEKGPWPSSKMPPLVRIQITKRVQK